MKALVPAIALLLGFAGPASLAQTSPNPHGPGTVDEKLLPRQELTPQILYQYLLAEIAAQGGQFGISAGAYIELARNTRDPRVIRRAAEIAYHARQYDTALEAITLWLSIDPSSQQARQMQATMLLAAGRVDDLAAKLVADLAATDAAGVGEAILQLERGFARYPDRAAVNRLIAAISKAYPQLPEAHLARARAAMGVGEADVARAAVDRALELRPGWEAAALGKAELLPKGAAQIDFLKAWVAAHPSAQQARLGYARVLVGDKRYEEARAEFRRLLEANPDNPEILYAVGILSLQVNVPGDAEAPLKRFVEIGRGDLNPARFYLGQIAEQAERHDEALHWYDQVNGGENALPAIIRAARVLARQKKLDEARERLRVARETGNDDVRLTVAEGHLLRDAGRHEDALAFFTNVLGSQPDQPDLLYETSLAAEKLGRLDVVERHLRRLIALKPESPQGYNALGYTFADHNIRLEEAAELVDKALALSPDDSFILDSKGWVLFRQGKLAEALEHLKRAYDKQPDAEIAAHIGEVLWALGRVDEAKAIWRDAVKAHPANEALNATIKRFQP